jgi:hypothetical protein
MRGLAVTVDAQSRIPTTFSIIFQLRVAPLRVNAAVPAIYNLPQEAWEARSKTLKAIDLAALTFPSDGLNWKLDGN